ncbi:MAG: adenine phosphoribosyltransferase [Vicinamibacterales bacterium]
MDHLKAKIRHIADFPKPGILFYDITPLLSDPQGFRDTIDAIAAPYMGEDIDQVVGIESRGFILGAAVANALGCGFVPIRKPGKLPSATHSESYNLEYGTDALEIHTDAMGHKARILIVDDVLATGGTARAAADLVKRAGGNILGLAFLIELDFLHGRGKLAGEPVYSVLRY